MPAETSLSAGLFGTELVAPHLTPPDPAPEIGIKDRAHYLISALRSLNEANSLYGLGIASQIPDYAGDIQDRYGADFGSLMNKAPSKKERLIAEARFNFRIAAGESMMLIAGCDEEYTKETIDQAWKDFYTEFGVGYDNVDADKRNDFIKNLEKSSNAASGRRRL